MPSAKEMSKAQPMSISQLCQQDYTSDEELHNAKQDLDQDPLDLNSEDRPAPPYMTSRNNGYTHRMHQNGHESYNQSSDVEQDFDQFSNHPRHIREEQPEAEQLAAQVLGDLANATRSTATASSGTGSSFMIPAAPFISRMSSLPLVNSALKAYENGKQNSKVMKVCHTPSSQRPNASLRLTWA